MLLNTQNAKTVKGEYLGYLTGVMYLAPHKSAGVGNVCPAATEGCAAACLADSGMLRMPVQREALIRRTLWYYSDREGFLAQVVKEIRAIIRKAEREGLIPCIRLNGTADLQWENIRYQGMTLMEMFPNVQFYDYTKILGRFSRDIPANYHLTASYVPERHAELMHLLHSGLANVAVVMRDSTKPNRRANTWNVPDILDGIPVVSGDDHDLRFLDNGPGNWIGLKAKGNAWKDDTGFVLSV